MFKVYYDINSGITSGFNELVKSSTDSKYYKHIKVITLFGS